MATIPASAGPVLSESDPEAVCRAQSYDEIKPLVDLCHAGMLFEVQDWIAAGKPVNSPALTSRKPHRWTALDTAIERGFHSLVRVLLEAGAVPEPDGWGGPLGRTLKFKRFEITRLLIEHGCNPNAVPIGHVLETRSADLIDFFVERRADLDSGRPLAFELCERNSTALHVLRKYRDRFPTFQEQANTALRHHCKEGRVRWCALMLWAGADPYAPGPDDPSDSPESNAGCAVEIAATYGHSKIFNLKPMVSQPKHPAMCEALYASCADGDLALVRKLLEAGVEPNDQDNGGASVLWHVVWRMSWPQQATRPRHDTTPIDTPAGRELMKGVRLLVEHGARWAPQEPSDIAEMRKALVLLSPSYTVELVSVLAEHRAASKEDLRELVRTGRIAGHVKAHAKRLKGLTGSLRD